MILTIGLSASPEVSVAVEQPVINLDISPHSHPQLTRLEISLSRRKVTLYEENKPIKSYPVAVGRRGWETPKGHFQVMQMLENPTWIHPLTGERIPGGAAKNPLGRYWIGFWTDGRDWIGFHGTPDPSSVGQAVSHGCIRMYNEDIEELFSQVTIGTQVIVVP